MSQRIVLASGSAIRASLLARAGVEFRVEVARIDEAAVTAALHAEGAPARDVADTLAEHKALRISRRNPQDLVIGCDQVLQCDGLLLDKPASPDEACRQLRQLRGRSHRLFTAAVVAEGGVPVWRHVSEVRLDMHDLSDPWIEAYVARNWDSIRESVGGYKIEEEGVRLFSRIEGDYFAILGLPIVELLSWLALRGAIAT